MDEPLVLEAVRRRIQEAAGATYAPATADAVAATERSLGFRLPPLYVQLLTQVANGGFGPGFGLIGLPPDGFVDTDLPGDLVSTYLLGRGAVERGLRTPEALVVLCTWGCGRVSYIDAARPEAPVVSSELTDKGVEYVQTSSRFRDWIAAWANGNGAWVDPVGTCQRV